MKRLTLSLLSCLLVLGVQAQLEIDHYAIVPLGGYSVDGTLSISYTVGQVEVKTLITNNGTLILTQGFQQPELIGTAIEGEEEVIVNYQLYPNPTDRFLTVKLTTEKPVELELSLLNLLGQPIGIPVQRKRVQGEWSAEFDLQGAAEGYYLLVLRSANGQTAGAWKVHKLDR